MPTHPRPRPSRASSVRGHAPVVRALAAACSVALLAACTANPDEPQGPQEPPARSAGPDDGQVVNAADLEELAVTVELREPAQDEDDGGFAGAAWWLRNAAEGDDLDADGTGTDVVGDVEIDGEVARWAPDGLEDGDHRLEIVLPGVGSPDDPLVLTHDFTVAATPPELTLTEPSDGVLVASRGLTLAGESTGATVALAGQEVDVADDGTFTLELDEAPEGEVELTATDEHGNTATLATSLVVVPSRVEVDEVRAFHVTPHAWATPSFRERILGYIEDGLVTAIQLDLKDEGGRIGYRTEVELARESGAAEDVYDLADAIEILHDLEVPVIGRIVAFRDPVLGAYARDNGHEEWLVRTPEGEPYTSRYGCCFLSFANDEVIEYNLAIAEEAAAMGVDDILWDYIRRPDGSPDAMVYDGLSDDADGATLEEAVVEFTRLADERLAPYGVQHGASLYGIAADRPTQIAQDVAGMSPHLDYVAPMIYPSHWGPGEYGVADPNRQPYDIITATLEVWQDAIVGDRVRIVPWLEDTNYRAWDRREQVREQIRATLDQGIDEWLMWDPVVNYTTGAYESRPAGSDADSDD